MPGFFLMTAEEAEEYFRRKIHKEAVTEKEALEILKDMEAEGRILARGSTTDTKEEFAEKLAEFANVMIVSQKKKPGFTNEK